MQVIYSSTPSKSAYEVKLSIRWPRSMPKRVWHFPWLNLCIQTDMATATEATNVKLTDRSYDRKVDHGSIVICFQRGEVEWTNLRYDPKETRGSIF